MKADGGILFHDSILRFIKFHKGGGDKVYEQENKIHSRTVNRASIIF